MAPEYDVLVLTVTLNLTYFAKRKYLFMQLSYHTFVSNKAGFSRLFLVGVGSHFLWSKRPIRVSRSLEWAVMSWMENCNLPCHEEYHFWHVLRSACSSIGGKNEARFRFKIDKHFFEGPKTPAVAHIDWYTTPRLLYLYFYLNLYGCGIQKKTSWIEKKTILWRYRTIQYTEWGEEN